MKKKNLKKRFRLKGCQQADKSVRQAKASLLANQKVGTMGCLRHHLRFGATNINIYLVLSPGNNIAETINLKTNPLNSENNDE